MVDDPPKGISSDLIAQWERLGVDAVAADLEKEHRGGRTLVKGPPGTGVKAHAWVKYKRAQAEAERKARETAESERRKKAEQIVQLKPTFMGMSLDVNAAWRWARDWWSPPKQ